MKCILSPLFLLHQRHKLLRQFQFLKLLERDGNADDDIRQRFLRRLFEIDLFEEGVLQHFGDFNQQLRINAVLFMISYLYIPALLHYLILAPTYLQTSFVAIRCNQMVHG